MRRYREENRWSTERCANQSQNIHQQTCLNKLKKSRVQFSITQPAFLALADVVEACCSDDESIAQESDIDDDESLIRDLMECDEHDGKSSARDIGKSKVTKFTILKLPWRHPRMDAIMKKINWLSCPTSMTCPQRNRRPRRVRERLDNAKYSQITAPLRLPANCYNPEWIKDSPLFESKDLKSKAPTDLKNYLHMLESL